MNVYFKWFKLPDTKNSLHHVKVDDESVDFSHEAAIDAVKTELPHLNWKITSPTLVVINGGKF